MTPYDPQEERMQRLESRVTDVEAGPYFCAECGGVYNSTRAAEACADEDRKPDFHD